MVGPGLLEVSDRHLQGLAETPGMDAVLWEAKELAKKCPDRWVACPQLLSFREWLRVFIGLSVEPREPQLAIMWRPVDHHWHVAFACSFKELEGRFQPREHRFRLPRVHVEYYFR